MNKGLKINSLNINIETRSTIIKPIVDEFITEKYIGWLNDKNINEFLEVRHNIQTKQTIIDYINLLRRERLLLIYK